MTTDDLMVYDDDVEQLLIAARSRPSRMALAVPQPAEAMASERPCELYAYHAPMPSRTEGHHRHPVFLQNRVYGLIRDAELLWVCGLCHDNIHEWLGWLLGESRRPNPEPGRKAKAEARRTMDWYLEALGVR